MCSAAEDSDATVCGEEEEDAVRSPSLMETGTSAGLPGLGLLGRAGSVSPLGSSRQGRDEEGGVEWQELAVVRTTLQHARQSLEALQVSLSTESPQLQETMVGLREVSRQLKQAQEGIKACAAAASQGKVKQVREVTQELSTCMKELARLTGEARGRLGAGLSSFSMVHGSSGEELPLSQEIPLQGHTHHQAPPPSVHAHQSRGGTPVPQPTPPVAHPPAPSEPGPPSRTASGPTLPVLAVVQAPMTVTAPPPVVPHSVTACLSATAGLLGPDTSATNTSSSGGGAPVAQGGGAHIAQGRHRAASPKAGALPGEEGSRSRSADFAETVPLQVLLREGLLCPGLGCLSTGIMGVKFVASLSADGSLSLPTGQVFSQPHLWVNACWEKIGHRSKRTKKSQAYKMILYKGDTLMHFCQLYNRSKVKSYLQETSATPKTHHGTQQPPSAPPLPPTLCTRQRLQAAPDALPAGRGRRGDIPALLASCQVVPVKEEEVCPPCYLPAGFWGVSDHVPDVEWFSGDLEWK